MTATQLAESRFGSAVGVVLGAALVRRWQMKWGATAAEVAADLPGDELMPRADRSTTRAVTITAPPHEVWPWLVQMGQGRGGLYSYDFLENIIGCDIHSADHIVADWQRVTVGDPFRLHPDVALHVVVVEPDHALVVRGGVPMGDTAPPYDSTWAFVLNELADGNTRLVIRERYAFTRWWASLIVEPVLAVSFVMTQRCSTASVPAPNAGEPRHTTRQRRQPRIDRHATVLLRACTSTGCHWEPART